MSETNASNAGNASDETDDEEARSTSHQDHNTEPAGQTMALVLYRPTLTSFLELLLLDPSQLFRHIQLLESRVIELTEQNEVVRRENIRLQSLTTSAAIGLISADSAPLSMANRLSSSETELTNRPSSGTTAISSPGLKIMYLRKGVEPEPEPQPCSSSSSHQLVVLQRPTFQESRFSDMSVNTDTDASVSALPLRSASSSEIRTGTLRTRIVTYSLDNITLNGTIPPEGTDEGSDSVTGPTRSNHSHSWPSFRLPQLEDFTEYLIRYLEEATTDSEPDSDDDLYDADGEGETSSLDRSLASSASNMSASETDIETETESSVEPLPGCSRYISVLPHPFAEPLRQIHEEQVTVRLAPESIPLGRRLARRRAFVRTPPRDFGNSSWARTVRAQIFFNLSLARGIDSIEEVEETDLDWSTDSTESVNSLGNEPSDLSIPDLPEHELDEGDGQQIEDAEQNGQDGPDDDEAADIVPDAVDLSSSEDSEDSGRGDAASGPSSSSTTSQTSAAGGPQNPTFPYPPSDSNLGGKYGYLQAAVRRPRAPDGHRFVVSLFGTLRRRNNEMNLPTWVPVYAERLECILHQFMGNSDSNQNVATATEILRSPSPSSRSTHSFKSVVTCTASQESQLGQIAGCYPTNRPRHLKSCLRMSREGSTGETIPKNLSWSQKITVRNVDPLRPPNQDRDEEPLAFAITEKPNDPFRTRSCPDLYIKYARQEAYSPLRFPTATTAFSPPRATDELTQIFKVGKKKGIVSKFFDRLFCTCGNNLENSSSQDCTYYNSRT